MDAAALAPGTTPESIGSDGSDSLTDTTQTDISDTVTSYCGYISMTPEDPAAWTGSVLDIYIPSDESMIVLDTLGFFAADGISHALDISVVSAPDTANGEELALYGVKNNELSETPLISRAKAGDKVRVRSDETEGAALVKLPPLSRELTGSVADCTVTAKGTFPQNGVFGVTSLTETYLMGAVEKNELIHPVTELLFGFDTRVNLGVAEFVPAEGKSVEISLTAPAVDEAAARGDLLRILAIEDDGSISEIPAFVSEGTLSFTAPHFSAFAVVSDRTAFTVETETEGVGFAVSCGGDSGIPRDAVLTAIPVSGEGYYSSVLSALGWTEEEHIYYNSFFELSLSQGGEKLVPKTPVTVNITFDDTVENKQGLKAVLPGGGSCTAPECRVSEEGVLSFEAADLSVVGVLGAMHKVAEESSEVVEVAVYSLEEQGSTVAVENSASVSAAEEGIETVVAYEFSSRESSITEAAAENAALTADGSVGAEINERESISIYTVENNMPDKVIVEDITGTDELYTLDDSVTAIAVVRDTGLRRQNFELYPDAQDPGRTVTLDGMMPKEAAASAVDVTDTLSENGDEGEVRLAAYDITITEGDKEYQPVEGKPISVEITDPRITAGEDIALRHILSDGSFEYIYDLVVEEGRVSFEAKGFSVYEIVVPPEPKDIPDDRINAQELSELTSPTGFYLSITKDGKTYYFANEIVNTNYIKKVQDTRNTLWYFEKLDSGKYHIYTIKDDVRYYMQMIPNGSMDGWMRLPPDIADATDFDVSLWKNTEGVFYISYDGRGLNMHGGVSGKGFAGYKKSDDIGAKVVARYPDRITEDPQNLDGLEFGLVLYRGTTSDIISVRAEQVTDNKGVTRLKGQKLGIMSDPLDPGKPVFTTGSDYDSVSIWKFTAVPGTEGYYITSETAEGTKYMKITSAGMLLADTPDNDCILTVSYGTGNFKDKITISGAQGTEPYYINLQGGNFGKHTVANNDGYLMLVEPSDIVESDKVVYEADKISVSDIHDGDEVVIYVRLWDDKELKYRFYVLSQGGTLLPAAEIGDRIEWQGSAVCRSIWDFTVYTGDDGTENGYYEFQNTYTGRYLAPEIGNNQLVSYTKKGVNLEGRRNGGYSSTIMAWDKPYYQYAALAVVDDNGTDITKCVPLSQAGEFYFAVIEKRDEENLLTTVETVDNTQHGITMKMVNFPNTIIRNNTTEVKNAIGTPEATYANDTSEAQNNVMGIRSSLYKGKIPNTVFATKDKGEGQAFPDLVSKRLESNGYPDVTFTDNPDGTQKSLGELFSGAVEVNHLFLDKTYNESGYFEYSCSNNYAYLDQTTNKFVVYDQVGSFNKSGPANSHGQFMPYNNIVDHEAGGNKYGKVASSNSLTKTDESENALPISDPRFNKPIYEIKGTVDYFFGMELSADFTQTASGCDAWGNDMIFEFTGDDDFWLYVDGVLVIDLGGIHKGLSGSVNFRTGDVIVNNGTPTNLKALFEAAGADTSAFETDENIFKDYTKHSMKLFYMERGAGASNLHLRFNLSEVRDGQVKLSKEVKDHNGKDFTGSDAFDFSLVDYPFRIGYYKTDGTGPYYLGNQKWETSQYVPTVTYPNSTRSVRYFSEYKGKENVFIINAGETININFPDETMEYFVEELNVNSSIYEKVECNDDPLYSTEETAGEQYKDYKTDTYEVGEQPLAVFKNYVREDGIRSLEIQKDLVRKDPTTNTYVYANDGSDTAFFDYRLYLGDEFYSVNNPGKSLPPTYMHKYYVKDPDGVYCRWDPDQSRFVPISGIKDLKNIPEAYMDSAVFYTGPNGTISMIPAGYTVVVPGLPVGTQYKVEEENVPDGYILEARSGEKYSSLYGSGESYEGDARGYINYSDTSSYGSDYEQTAQNAGKIIISKNAKVIVCNTKGFGFTATKKWSDDAYVTGRPPIFLALYLKKSGEEARLISGSVRRIEYPDTECYWFYYDLAEGADSIGDYEVREVDLTNPVYDPGDSSIVSSYSAITPVEQSGFTHLADTQGGPSDFDYTYKVSYEHDPHKDNVRTATITNTRTGGIMVRLSRWMGLDPDREPTTETILEGGVFELCLEEGTERTVVGKYTSDVNGLVTILYDAEITTDENNKKVYVLRQISAPGGYMGFGDEVRFYITKDGDTEKLNWLTPVTDEGWANHRDGTALEKMTAYINIYNKTRTIRAAKYDKADPESQTGLGGAVFALYRQVTDYNTKLPRADYYPIENYERLVSDEGTGIIVARDENGQPLIDPATNRPYGINEYLADGNYYLRELTAPAGYTKLTEDILMTVANGRIYVSSSYAGVAEKYVDTDTDRANAVCELQIYNSKNDVKLHITKQVTGAFGDKSKQFTFSFTVGDGNDIITAYTTMKGGVSDTIHSGETFTLSHGESIEISLPAGTQVKIKETDADGYSVSMALNGTDADSDVPFILQSDSELVVTNKLDVTIPTGIRTDQTASVTVFAGLLAVLALMDIRRRRSRKKG